MKLSDLRDGVAIATPIIAAIGMVFTLKGDLSELKEDMAILPALQLEMASLRQTVNRLDQGDFVPRREISRMIELAIYNHPRLPSRPEPFESRSDYMNATPRKGEKIKE